MKVITKLMYRGRTFLIVFNAGYYMAIEEKYIDENGRTNKVLNGFELHADETLQGCLNKIIDYQI